MSDTETEPLPPAHSAVRKFLQRLVVCAVLVTGALGIYALSEQELSKPKAASIPHYTQQGRQISDDEWNSLTQQLEATGKRINALEAALAAAQNGEGKKLGAGDEAQTLMLEAKIEELQSRVDSIQKNPSTIEGAKYVMMLGRFAELRRNAQLGKDFARELAALKTVASFRPTTVSLIDTLQPFTEHAIPTVESLQKTLEASIDKWQDSMDDGTSLLGNLRTLVRIRKEGEPEGDDDGSVIARIESKLKAGNVDAARKESEGLSTKAAGFFSGWQGESATYLKLQEALYAIELDLTQSSLLPERL